MPTHYQGDEATRRALDAFIKLSRARKMMSTRTGRLLAEYRLTESQLGTLEALYYLGPMCQSDIGEKLLVTDGNMTMVMKSLTQRGLVSRQRDPDDRRQIMVSLTDEGQRLIGELFPRHARNLAEMLSVLSPDEQDELGRLCKILGRQSRDGDGAASG